ncbi:IAA-amino acid hydrolase ILR1-like 8 [Cucumis melo var. makuwa]|uniref:IAA-amino acid hydrolase ILR1-like 8 n=1 Tax=Cucumis melo var. makuwa TaxID=1194695 RepID=A0A5D3C2Y6_CUCMM|nr:IAA-amino acid hydrolase ILR1-like 8 [Cucumis melo var. makuwa]
MSKVRVRIAHGKDEDFPSLHERRTMMESGIPLHSPYLILDEQVLPLGAALHAAVAISYLDQQHYSVSRS